MTMPTPLWMLAAMALALAVPGYAKYPDDLPPAEKEIAGTVDPLGLPFSDSLRRFDERFADTPDAPFVVGLTHDLVKVWPNKYWFRGASVPAGARDAAGTLAAKPILAAAGETQAFQVAVLPRMGAAEATYTITAEVRGAPGVTVQVFREVFVKTADPGYPRFETDRWPDPLVPENSVTVSGVDLGLFWVDVKLPAAPEDRTVEVLLTVSGGGSEVRVVQPITALAGLDLRPKDFPLVAWFRPRYGTKTLSSQQMMDMAGMVLDHHMQAMDILKGRFSPGNTADFDAAHRTLAARGQNVFELDKPGSKYDYKLLYDHVKRQGWMDQALVYSNVDEPLEDVFYEKNVPWYQDFKQKYPEMRVFLASQYHPRMETGCDIWMTDISTEGYDPAGMRDLKAPTLWHYYCHLPIHVQFRAPLTMAPNMEVDCEALQHRLALWMSDYYGAKGLFIWAGFSAGGLKDDFWQTLELESKPGGYPYGGIHNGNNFLVYPPQSDGGPVLPSVRLKVLRAGMQDLALLRAVREMIADGRIKGAQAARMKELLDPKPYIFMHPQYWDRLPETLLRRRASILQVMADVERR